MLQPAARISDMHICPVITPGIPPVPHVGGPLLPPGSPVVFIGDLPAATLGTRALCSGAVDTVIMGSTKVFICNTPAARMGDTCAHGGTIVTGYPMVLLG